MLAALAASSALLHFAGGGPALSVAAILRLTAADLAPYGWEDMCFAGDRTVLTFSWGADVTALVRFSGGANFVVKVVRDGIKSVPFLVSHLSDPTKLQNAQVSPNSGVVDDYYDATNPHGAFMHGMWNPKGDPALPRDYHVTVGDVCFFLLGQIVNRNYDSLQPLYVRNFVPHFNGPGVSPILAADARRDWGRIDSGRLKRSLIADVLRPTVAWRDDGAMRRLIAYFPGGYLEALAIRRLSAPVRELGLEEQVAPYAYGVRRHEVLLHPGEITPYQYAMFVLSIADIKSGKIDRFLKRTLVKMGARKHQTALDDKAAIQIVGRLLSSPRADDRIEAERFCVRRAKASPISSYFKDALRLIRSRRGPSGVSARAKRTGTSS